MKKFLYVILAVVISACGAHGKNGEAAGGKDSAAAESSGDSAEAGTPVTVVTVERGGLNDYIQLNAVSAFLQKSYVKAIANGYLDSSDVYPGKYIEKGQILFTMQTKESKSIGNAIEKLDTALHFSGKTRIRANQRGYITQLNHQAGDYVQDGEQLAVISDRSSFVFLLDLPYELRPFVLNKKTVELDLPDGTKLAGEIGPAMPTLDSVSQTQNVVIRVPNAGSIPENLIAKVRILKSHTGGDTQSLPKEALLTDETESTFWVMKLLDSTTAVKVRVKKGLETTDRVEILQPVFAPGDKILVTGNYGLPDTAKVRIQQAGGAQSSN